MGDVTTKEKNVIVTAYEEVPPAPRRRRPGSGRAGATSSSSSTTTAEVTTWQQAKAAPAAYQAGVAAGARYRGSNRRALLLAYAQHLRRRDQRGASGERPRVLLEWGKWKTQGHPGAGAGGDAVRRRRSLYCRFRLWTRAFLRRVRRIGENALCKNKEISQPANVG
uniref:Uncharacterized protein n=1 Tax=Oryza nivara TaxID=4536 RepID=A0A0E0GSG8_ORYNI